MTKLPWDAAALLAIAQDADFFEEQGLSVEFKPAYDSGYWTVDAMLKGEADLAATSEFVLAQYALEEAPILGIASINETHQNFSFVARKSAGVTTLDEVRGNRVGIVPLTVAEFYLARFFVTHGLSFDDIEAVSYPSQTNMTEALIRGEIDAAALNSLGAHDALGQLGDDGVSWQMQNLHPLYVLLTGRTEWVTTHTDEVVRFLRALEAAEQFASANPAKAQEMTARVLGLELSYVRAGWEGNDRQVALERALLAAMEDEVRWLVRNERANGESHHDLLHHLYPVPLRQVAPSAVSIIE